MSPKVILSHLRQRPFEPFRLHLSNGSFCDVRDPESALVSRTVIHVAMQKNSPSDLPRRVLSLHPDAVTRVEIPINGQPMERNRSDLSQ